MRQATVIIMAAGKGERLGSPIPKPLVYVGDDSMLNHAIHIAKPLCRKPIVVIGSRYASAIMQQVHDPVTFVQQGSKAGTGGAVLSAVDKLAQQHSHVIVIPSDHPFLTTECLKQLCLLREQTESILTLAAVQPAHFQGIYKAFLSSGNIVRDDQGSIVKITDGPDKNKKANGNAQINVSYYCFDRTWLINHIEKLELRKDKNEYYLTDLINLAANENKNALTYILPDPLEGLGVNTPEQLEYARAIAQQKKNLGKA